jgi:hypothetical protein
MKLTGRIEDPNSIALQIVSSSQQGYHDGINQHAGKKSSRANIDGYEYSHEDEMNLERREHNSSEAVEIPVPVPVPVLVPVSVSGPSSLSLSGDSQIVSRLDERMIETILEQVIEALEGTRYPLPLSLQDSTGHQVLHYAVILQMHRLIDLLLRMPDPDHLRDIDLQGNRFPDPKYFIFVFSPLKFGR